MDLARVLGLFVQGSASNWWGLGCPAHCSGSLTVLGLAFGFGAPFGFLCAVIFFSTALFAPVAQAAFTPDPSPLSSSLTRPAALRLRGYLHEQVASH